MTTEQFNHLRFLINAIDTKISQVTEQLEYEDSSEQAEAMVETMETLQEQITTWQESEGLIE